MDSPQQFPQKDVSHTPHFPEPQAAVKKGEERKSLLLTESSVELTLITKKTRQSGIAASEALDVANSVDHTFSSVKHEKGEKPQVTIYEKDTKLLKLSPLSADQRELNKLKDHTPIDVIERLNEKFPKFWENEVEFRILTKAIKSNDEQAVAQAVEILKEDLVDEVRNLVKDDKAFDKEIQTIISDIKTNKDKIAELESKIKKQSNLSSTSKAKHEKVKNAGLKSLLTFLKTLHPTTPKMPAFLSSLIASTKQKQPSDNQQIEKIIDLGKKAANNPSEFNQEKFFNSMNSASPNIQKHVFASLSGNEKTLDMIFNTPKVKELLYTSIDKNNEKTFKAYEQMLTVLTDNLQIKDIQEFANKFLAPKAESRIESASYGKLEKQFQSSPNFTKLRKTLEAIKQELLKQAHASLQRE